jgi:hypothetical protein
MPNSTASDEEVAGGGWFRRFHAAGLDENIWWAQIIGGTMAATATGFNLAQFVLHGRLYIWAGRHETYWAYWPDQAGIIVWHGVVSALILLAGVAVVARSLLYSLLTRLWGEAVPAYKRLGALNMKD